MIDRIEKNERALLILQQRLHESLSEFVASLDRDDHARSVSMRLIPINGCVEEMVVVQSILDELRAAQQESDA